MIIYQELQNEKLLVNEAVIILINSPLNVANVIICEFKNYFKIN